MCEVATMRASKGAETLAGFELFSQTLNELPRGTAYLLQDVSLDAARRHALHFLYAGTLLNETSLLISRERPGNLVALADEIGFDLRRAHAQQQVNVVRLPPPSPAGADAVVQTLTDLTALVENHRPERVVLDDVLSFTTTLPADSCQTALAPLLRTLVPLHATLLLTTASPATAEARRGLSRLSSQVAGVLQPDVNDGFRLVQPVGTPMPPSYSADVPAWLPAGDGLPAVTRPPEEREAFSLRVQECFHRHAVSSSPFVLVALRSDQPGARPLDFSLLCTCVHNLLGATDAWLLEPDRRRLLVLLDSGRTTDTQRFFARLKARLLDTAPDQADAYLAHITAIVLSNGGSFQTAEDLLYAVLDEE